MDSYGVSAVLEPEDAAVLTCRQHSTRKAQTCRWLHLYKL